MSQSLMQMHVHVIFSTKNRTTYLTPEVRSELWPYIATVLSNLGSPAKAIGGTSDHAHILCSLSKNMSIAELVEEVKKPASRWLKTKSDALRNFYWQNGYAAFSVSQSDVARVKQYIKSQEEHHRRRSFQDELREFFAKHAVSFDERYLWD